MSATFVTPLTRLLGIRTPVVAAAMAGVSGGRLAAAATNGGGFGFISAGRAASVDEVIREIDTARTSLRDPRKGLLPIGVGFFGYELDAQPHMVKILDGVLTLGVRSIWLSFGENLGKWVEHIRDNDDRGVERTLIFIQLPTAADAFKASNEWDIDAIVLQGRLGTESGGHSVDKAPSILSLLPEVVQNMTRPIPILAAGGLVTGSHLASMLALGASGIVVGTRFSTATESVLPVGKKEKLIAAKSTSRDATVLSPMFDELLGRRHVWPPGTTARGLRMESMLEYEKDGRSIEERRRIFETQNHSGGTHEIIWSGTSVGLINKMQSAEEIMREINDEALQVLKKLPLLVNPSQS